MTKTLATLTAIALLTTIACAKKDEPASSAERHAAQLAQAEHERLTHECPQTAKNQADQLNKINSDLKVLERYADQSLIDASAILNVDANASLAACTKALVAAKKKVRWSKEYYIVKTGDKPPFEDLRKLEGNLTYFICLYSKETICD